MKRLVLFLLAASVAACSSPALAGAAPRMYVGFHDDPNFRYEERRAAMLDQARAANTTIVRTLVTWANVAPTRPRTPSNPFDPAYRFDDLDELVRNTQARGMEVLITIWGTPKWANGNKTPNFLPTRTERPDRTSRARVASRYSGRRAGYPVRALLLDLERVEPPALPGAAVRRPGQVGRPAQLREARRGGLRRASRPGTRARRSRSAATSSARPRQGAAGQVRQRTRRAASRSSWRPRTRGSSSTRGRTTRIRCRSTRSRPSSCAGRT